MARGDLVLFKEFADQLGSKNHAFENGGDTFKLGLVNSTITPLTGDTTPTWGDYSTNEVGTGGGYTAGGISLANQSYDEVDGVASFDADNIAIAQDGSGFTLGYWGILYNDTNGTDMAIGFLDLGGPVSEQAGPININWGATGIFKTTIVA